MPEFKRVGPRKIFTDMDDDGNTLDHWKIVSLAFFVEAQGSDGKVHAARADMNPDLDESVHEYAFLTLEACLKNQMIEQGAWSA